MSVLRILISALSARVHACIRHYGGTYEETGSRVHLLKSPKPRERMHVSYVDSVHVA